MTTLSEPENRPLATRVARSNTSSESSTPNGISSDGDIAPVDPDSCPMDLSVLFSSSMRRLGLDKVNGANRPARTGRPDSQPQGVQRAREPRVSGLVPVQ